MTPWPERQGLTSGMEPCTEGIQRVAAAAAFGSSLPLNSAVAGEM